MHAFITSRLDNMNALFFQVSECHLKQLQRIQHNSARLIKKEKKSCHITPILHWRLVEYRISYKILLLVFKCRHGESPSYLASMLEDYRPSRSLRSEAGCLLREPTACKKYGERPFLLLGPGLGTHCHRT